MFYWANSKWYSIRSLLFVSFQIILKTVRACLCACETLIINVLLMSSFVNILLPVYLNVLMLYSSYICFPVLIFFTHFIFYFTNILYFTQVMINLLMFYRVMFYFINVLAKLRLLYNGLLVLLLSSYVLLVEIVYGM